MKLLKNPYINAAVIAVLSVFYALVLIVTSGHLEFQRVLGHGKTLNSPFWNGWSAFVRQGNLKYVGYGFIAAAICIFLLSLVRKKRYDEYQAGIIATGLIVTGAALLLLFPTALLLIMSDPNYAVEALIFLVVVHWSVFLFVSLICSIKWCRA